MDQLRIEVADSLESVNDMLSELGMTDGLPVVPPTQPRVGEALRYLGWDPNRSIGKLPPKWAEVTAHHLAVNAVMAGCRPEFLPAVAAAIAGLAEEKFNLYGIQSTTGTATPLAIVNGPIVGAIGLNAGANCLGPGNRANATIGRAIRLLLLNVGGATPGLLDMATMGQPGKYTFCFAENEEKSPWTPLHVDRGCRPDESAVTVVGAGGTVEIVDIASRSAEGLLTTIAGSMKIAGSLGGGTLLGGGEPLLLLPPEHAALCARDGLTKSDVQRFLWERVRLPLAELSPDVAEHLVRQRTDGGAADPQGPVLAAERPEDVMIVVTGGVGAKATYVPTWGGGTRAVTKKVPAL
ncbi:MAG: hypothetical protein HY329_11550 [Chloroflexi bacterium]|nr:hypothetical protein [Chloroflexota bacterium]